MVKKKINKKKKVDKKIVENRKTKEEEAKSQNKQLRNVFIGILIIGFVFILLVLFSYYNSNFKYESTDFKVVKEGKLVFYNTAFAIFSPQGEHVADYNFYIRNDPRKLKDIPWEGDYILMENMVINMTNDFHCEGDGIIAIANFLKVHEFFDVTVIKDEDAGCDELGRYTFVQIEEGNETKVQEYGPSCYRISINNCEILKGTERFILETFTAANEQILGN